MSLWKSGKISDSNKKVWKTTVICIFLAALLISAAFLVRSAWNYHKAGQEYDNLKNYTKEAVVTGKGNSTAGFKVDFSSLKQLNTDCEAWIRFPNLDISYPVMQGEDNQYYLTHTFGGSELTAASIFIDNTNQADFSDDITYIYGHNMKNKSMFGKLGNYKDESFYEKNPGFYIYTPQYTYYYKIFSCFLKNVGKETNPFYTNFSSKEAFSKYLYKIASDSAYPIEADINAGSKAVALVTCNKAGNDYRFLVYAIQTKAIPTEN